MNEHKFPWDKFSDSSKAARPMVDEYRVALVDIKTNQYVGILDGQIKLLGNYSDETKKPFILKSKFNFLPRIGEKLRLANLKRPIIVEDILHDIIISKIIPPYILLFVRYT